MTQPLSDDDRIRFLWHFLIMAAVKKVILIPDVLFETFAVTSRDLETISEICAQHGTPNLIGVIADQSISFPIFKSVDLEKLTHTVSEFPAITDDETPIFNFYMAKYCCSRYAPEEIKAQALSALEFWETLDWEKIKRRILKELNALSVKIGDIHLVADEAKSTKEYKDHNWPEIPNFIKFTAEHAYLVIQHRDFSETLRGLNELETYYKELTADLSTQQAEAKLLHENIHSDITHRTDLVIKKSLSDIDDQLKDAVLKIEKMFEEAKGKYTSNLLEGYAEKFTDDAEVYKITAGRWLRGLTASFIITVSLAFVFLGNLRISDDPIVAPSLAIDVTDAAFWISGWTLLVLVMVMATTGLTRDSHKLFNLFGFNAPTTTGVLDDLRFAFRSSVGILPIIVVFYVLFRYFSFDITSPAITGNSFIVANDNQVNWAAFLTGAAPRVLLMLMAIGFSAFCANMYRIQKHLEAVNRYRATALASFTVFSNTIEETAAGKKRREKLFDELASLIYTPIQTGFHNDDKLKTSELANMVASAVSKISK